MSRQVVAVLALVLTGTSVAVPQSRRVLTTADYDRAVKMLAPALNGLVVGGTVDANWLPDGRFWYVRTTLSGTENVVVDPVTRQVDFDDDTITENTRAGYPVDFIPGAVIPGVGGHPRTVLFLTADAFGVLPPISRLSGEQAMYHFISGYTAKVAGTEAGVTEPKATFSATFSASKRLKCWNTMATPKRRASAGLAGA